MPDEADERGELVVRREVGVGRKSGSKSRSSWGGAGLLTLEREEATTTHGNAK